ncbi:hypothetical protein SCALIN_C25_0008 [Candidatus Scalindua japonica]|uniref:Uncharacterized protein n=1 Tax=Candidatus Scalindua japonica TaxID=1284222 RepID=A0A286U0G7_9BACT|nr:hypothetical protein [Candidatus Scalindua japonica]GAX61561.1 hypothetical protein SCALIN_C25_0008 [Candidatus Scalindua japonica]
MIKGTFVKTDKVSTLEIKEKRMILGEGKVKIINELICNYVILRTTCCQEEI